MCRTRAQELYKWCHCVGRKNVRLVLPVILGGQAPKLRRCMVANLGGARGNLSDKVLSELQDVATFAYVLGGDDRALDHGNKGPSRLD